MRLIWLGTTFTILLLFKSITVFSQVHFEPGYIVRETGDTVRGSIAFSRKQSNPKAIAFRENPASKVIELTPKAITGFGLTNELYISAVVQIDRTPYNERNLLFAHAVELTTDTVFLQALTTGSKSLLKLADTNGKTHFIIQDGKKFTTLAYKEYLQTVNGGNKLVKVETYKEQLRLYLQDCPNIGEQIQTTSYHDRHLADLFAGYYSCNGAKPGFVKKADRFRLDAGLLLGGSGTRVMFRSQTYKELANTQYNQFNSPVIGVFLDLGLPINNRQWSLANELIYTGYSVKGQYTDHESKSIFTVYTTSFDYHYLKLNTLLRYKYPFGKTFIYSNAGISNGAAVSGSTHKKQERHVYSSITNSEGPAMRYTKKHELGYVLGIGGGYKRTQFELRYEAANGMSKSPDPGSITRRIYGLLAYAF